MIGPYLIDRPNFISFIYPLRYSTILKRLYIIFDLIKSAWLKCQGEENHLPFNLIYLKRAYCRRVIGLSLVNSH